MTDPRSEAEHAVTPLLSAEEDQLFAELGIRARALAADPTIGGTFDPDVVYREAEMGALEEVRSFGQRLFMRWNRELHTIVCGGDPDDAADRAELVDALGVSEIAAAGYLATLIAGNLGIAPALATVAAAIVIRRFFSPAVKEFCSAWARTLTSLPR
jgi:hypothetical protein